MARFIALLTLAFSPISHGSNPSELLISLLKDIDTLSADYEQVGQPTTQKGQFWLSKPDRFRLSASAPISQTIVSDGENLWTYDLDLEQVIITPLRREAANIPLLLLARDPEKLGNTYDIEYFEDADRKHFIFLPLDKTQVIGSFTLSFFGNLPVRLIFQSAMQQPTVINFYNVSTVHVDAEWFNFKIPDNVDVIDDRLDTE